MASGGNGALRNGDSCNTDIRDFVKGELLMDIYDMGIRPYRMRTTRGTLGPSFGQV